ncbi:UvrD-helicase domain-containing protein [Agromyces seonyuensis]|uniref:DNA 3'-5' helicase n=1 Tax=Agromyces seonyuensis TaxID=2662446 RepID=A0A6I4P7X4_9MICO|nr:AAA family ATPase [Agromyces seonyuensis]
MSGFLGAAEIAERVGQHPPTAEQRAVIEAPADVRALVVAGAGSGKTETMANRVVWLLANRHVDVPDVLGLTFTRKAAGELAERVRKRTQQLIDRGVVPGLELDPLESSTVATYNSFAATIYREHALRIGREPDAAVLGEAAAFQLARTVVAASADERLVEYDKSLDRITTAVLGLSRAIGDNVVDSRDVRRFAEDFLDLGSLPTGSTRVKVAYKDFADALGAVSALPALVELADAYDRAKQLKGFVEFSDQIALALRIVEGHPDVVADYRSRFRTVLLDEYQDTSVVQTRLLSTLFAGHPVMAVGDPDQSIYGWRGASAANLARFGFDFAATDASGDGGDAVTFHLSTSWRNPRRVLDAANALIAPFAADAAIEKRALAPSPFAGDGSVEAGWAETLEEEADLVAQWFRVRLGERRADEEPKTAALLCRTYTKLPVFTAALAHHGVPFRVLGVAGLLEQPVVADLVATLRVLHDPTAGAELLRVLGGARRRIGPADLAELGRLARLLEGRGHDASPLDPAVRAELRGSVAAEEGASIIDALDFVAGADPEHGLLSGFSPAGRERLRTAGLELQHLRRRAGLGLVDFVGLVVHELRLDIEVAANPAQALGPASLEAFDELLAGFVDVAEHPTLGAFLDWLIEAEHRDRLSPRLEDADPGAVQVLSIHGSKGLEWNLVAIPRMVVDELPGRTHSARGWLSFGELPGQFLGDAAERPEFVWQGLEHQKEFVDNFAEFQSENKLHHSAEERRLAYVGVTRASEALLVTGSWWSSQSRPRGPGEFLRDLAVAGVVPVDAFPAASAFDENPREGSLEAPVWPLEPLGLRRGAVEAAAAAVRAAAEGPTGAGIGPELARDLELLLEERRRRDEPAVLDVPTRVPASRFKDYVDDPAAVLRSLARPMPERPYRATRIGTLFHSWAERRSLAGGSLDAFDDEFELDLLEPLDPGPAGEHAEAGEAEAAGDAENRSDRMTAAGDGAATGILADQARMDRLKATFLASEWGLRKPVAVELELHLPLDGTVFICKLDAVYEVPADSEAAARGIRYEVVDWKTGRAPTSARDLELKQTQLALYRLAYGHWAGVHPDEISAAFYFVDDDRVIRPDELQGEAELRAAWARVGTAIGGAEALDAVDAGLQPADGSERSVSPV